MKVTVTSRLNRRRWPSTRNAALPGPLLPNDVLDIVDEVMGEAVTPNNNKWLKTDKGFYVWSGGVKIEPSPYRLGRKINYANSIQSMPADWKAMAGQGVSIALIDSGVFMEHPNLQQAVKTEQDFSFSEYGAQDKIGHGTHCAGLIVGKIVNDDGVGGMAPAASVFSMKARHEVFSVSSTRLTNAIEEAIRRKVTIISMSLYLWDYKDEKFQRAVKKAAGEGIIMVAAAGEDDLLLQKSDPFYYPAYMSEEVISVGAVSRDFSSGWDISSLNNKLDLIIPFIDFTSCSIASKNGFEKLAGSSMSAALVTGIIALAAAGKKEIKTKTQVLEVLKAITQPLTNFKDENEAVFSLYKR